MLGGAWWWGDELESNLRPLYHLLSSAWLVAGVLWAERILDSWKVKKWIEKLWLLNACLVIGFGLFVGLIAAFAEARLQLHHISIDGNAIIALSEDQQTLWSRSFDSPVIHILQPEDLDEDGTLETVVATSAQGSRSGKLLIVNEWGEIVFDSDYLVSVWVEEPPYSARVPYQDIVFDKSGNIEKVYKPNGEVTTSFNWGNLWEKQRIPYYGLPGGPYEVAVLLAGDVDESRTREIVFAANARYVEGLNLIGKLSPSGEPGGTYWHPGSIHKLVLFEGVTEGMANIIAVGQNSFLDDETFDVVFGVSGHLLIGASCWNLLTPDDLSLPHDKQLEIPGVALCGGYHEVLRWYRWITPSGVNVAEIAASYRPLPQWGGPKYGLSPPEWTIDLTLSDGTYLGLDDQGGVLYKGGTGAASLEKRQ